MFCPECGTWNRAMAAECARCTQPLPELAAPAFDKPDEEITLLRRATGSRYRVLRRLGGGGMANVFLAEHALLGRLVVLKVLHPHLARDVEMAERFRREAEAAARLLHPNIVQILDFGTSEHAVYTVMPFLAGGSLADRIAERRIVSPAEGAAIAVQVSAALDYAHRQGVVHRDIKPDNVLFDEDGHALVTDFGIATARFHGRLTATGRAMGTPHYMSPEQAMGKLIDGRSDLYAVGVMLYETLVGFPPFDGADAFSIGYKQVHEAPVPVDQVDSRTPPELSAIVMKCLVKNPAERYARGHDLADALLRFLAADPEAAEQYRRSAVSRVAGTPAT
jgi:eukaryotic-like serine/threonine-protein kinase